MGDLFGTMTEGYPRFKRELRRATESSLELIVIVEGSLSDVLDGFAHSSWPGERMATKLFTLMRRYQLPIVFCTSRFEMCDYILNYFCAVGREYVARKKLERVKP